MWVQAPTSSWPRVRWGTDVAEQPWSRPFMLPSLQGGSHMPAERTATWSCCMPPLMRMTPCRVDQLPFMRKEASTGDRAGSKGGAPPADRPRCTAPPGPAHAAGTACTAPAAPPVRPTSLRRPQAPGHRDPAQAVTERRGAHVAAAVAVLRGLLEIPSPSQKQPCLPPDLSLDVPGGLLCHVGACQLLSRFRPNRKHMQQVFR